MGGRTWPRKKLCRRAAHAGPHCRFCATCRRLRARCHGHGSDHAVHARRRGARPRRTLTPPSTRGTAGSGCCAVQHADDTDPGTERRHQHDGRVSPLCPRRGTSRRPCRRSSRWRCRDVAISYVYWGLPWHSALDRVYFAEAAERNGIRVDFPLLIATTFAAGSVWQFGLHRQQRCSWPRPDIPRVADRRVEPGHDHRLAAGAAGHHRVPDAADTDRARTDAERRAAHQPSGGAALATSSAARGHRRAAGRTRGGRSALPCSPSCCAWRSQPGCIPLVTKAASLDINSMIVLLAIVALLMQRSSAAARAMSEAVVPCWRVILLYQLYAGVAGDCSHECRPVVRRRSPPCDATDLRSSRHRRVDHRDLVPRAAGMDHPGLRDGDRRGELGASPQQAARDRRRRPDGQLLAPFGCGGGRHRAGRLATSVTRRLRRLVRSGDSCEIVGEDSSDGPHQPGSPHPNPLPPTREREPVFNRPCGGSPPRRTLGCRPTWRPAPALRAPASPRPANARAHAASARESPCACAPGRT